MAFMPFFSDRFARLLYPQTMITLGILLALLVAFAIVIRLPATYEYDLKATKTFQLINRPWLNLFARWSTFMGNSQNVIILAAGAAVFAWGYGKTNAAWFIMLSPLSLPLNMLIKSIVRRKRPEPEHVEVVQHMPRWGFSFPSGHSMGSAAVYGTIAFFVLLYVPNYWLRNGLATSLAVLPVCVGLSRVYVGAHWLSDVVSGWAMGTFVVVALAAMYPV
jgi:undecaprenyl-diphosphatase